MKRNVFLFFMLFISYKLVAQSYEKTDLGIKANIQSMTVEIQVYSPQIIRVLRYPEGITVGKPDLVVLKEPEVTLFQTMKEGNLLNLKTSEIQLALDMVSGKVYYADSNNNLLLTEKEYGTQFTSDKDNYLARQAFLLEPDEVIYGLGQQQTGKMNQRGQRLEIRNENTKVCIPFIQSVKGYGIYWDNYSMGWFQDNPQEMSVEFSATKAIDYYFMFGKTGDGVVALMRELSGQSPMLPLWAYGFFQSRERYKTQAELLEALATFRKLQIPLDGIIQDWQYWGQDSLWNAMSFDSEKFPDPQGMINQIHKQNAHLMLVAWPGFGSLTKQYGEFKEKKMQINFETWPPNVGSKPYDVFNPQARDIYWDYLNKGLFSLGIDAWWMDSTEPDHLNVKDTDFDQPTYLGSYRSVKNVFPLMTVGGVYDHQRAVSSEKRVCILTRSAFAGQQRYGANTWNGDVHSRWDVFKRQIPGGLNLSLCGIPYWNTDIGGFWSGYNGATDPSFQELHIRWMQFGTFTPMMRVHGSSYPREIYQFGKRGDKAFDVQEQLINLRYRLLPYLYATAWNVTHHAGSFMRALYMAFPEDKKGYELDDEYLFGQSFLVAPVTEEGAKDRKVYLPEGADWYDFWTSKKVQGGQWLTRETPIEIMPLYVKAGTILPYGPKVQYAEEKNWDNMEIRVYPGSDGSFILYEDEKDNYNYEKGSYTEIPFHWNDKEQILTIGNREGSFNGMMNKRWFNIVIVDAAKGINDQPSAVIDKKVSYKGKEIRIAF